MIVFRVRFYMAIAICFICVQWILYAVDYLTWQTMAAAAMRLSVMYVNRRNQTFFCFVVAFECVCIFLSFDMDIWWSLTFSFTHIIHTMYLYRSIFTTMVFDKKNITDSNMDRDAIVVVFVLVGVCFDFLIVGFYLFFSFAFYWNAQTNDYYICTAHCIIILVLYCIVCMHTSRHTHTHILHELDQWITYHVIIMLSKILTSQLTEAWNVWI